MEARFDVKDILEVGRPQCQDITKKAILGPEKKSKFLDTPKPVKRPEGMTREVFNLLYNDKKHLPPLFPTDTSTVYQNRKANLSMKNVRPWKWMPITNPARTDGAVFHHWRRAGDEGKEYPFAVFNKKVQIPEYSDAEYTCYLKHGGWTKEETDHLFDLCKRFDLRFGVIADRWDREKYTERSIEDLKERYYGVITALARAKPSGVGSAELKNYVYDVDHERKRKEQLERLYSRTREQEEEEQMLLNELKKIEWRKKEHDKKTQKLAGVGDSEAGEEVVKRRPGRMPKRKFTAKSLRVQNFDNLSMAIASIKFPDLKRSGVHLRSHKMKLPTRLGQKKIKAIEELLYEMGLETTCIPTEEITKHFNELRSDLLLYLELETAMQSCQFKLDSLKCEYEASGSARARTADSKEGITTAAAVPDSNEQNERESSPLGHGKWTETGKPNNIS